MSVTTRLLAVLAVAVLLVGACGKDDDPAATDQPTTTVEASTTTAAEPTTTAPSTSTSTAVETLSDESRLSFAGIGPVRAGMTMAEAERAAGVPMRRSELPACMALATEGSPAGVELIFPGTGPLEFVFVREGSRVRSEGGIGLGDSQDEVLRAHPDAEVTNPDREVHRVVVKESAEGRRLMFEIDRGRVSVMWSGPNGSERADEICS